MAEKSEEERIAERLKDGDSVRRLAAVEGFDLNALLVAVKDEERKRFLTYKPYPKQLEFHNSLADERILSGGNQRIPLRTKILTPDGWRVSGELRVGDKVFTHKGEVTEIEAITEASIAPMYRMEFNDGTTADSSDDHQWLVIDGRGRETVRSTLELTKIVGRRAIPLTAAIEYAEREYIVPPYVMGLYLGNGWLRGKGEVMLSDSRDIYEELKKFIDVGTYNERTQTFRVMSYGRYTDALSGIKGAKNKYIPESYLRGSIAHRKELLAGLIDSDGHIDKEGRVCYYTASERLAADVCDLMRGLGCKVRCARRERGKYVSYDIRGRCPFKPNKVKAEHEWRYVDKLDYRTKTIKRIEYVGEEVQRCYRVKSETHTFIIDDYVATHNCGKTIAGCMEMAFHLTGNYPEWFKGHKIEPRTNVTSGEKEISCWVIGTDTKTVRDSLQAKLVGTVAKEFTDGCIHADLIDRDSVIMARGVTGLVDTIYIRHKSGCKAKLQFRSYEQGRGNLQSATVDACYCDEEPPSDIMGEIRARLGATGGFLYMAFTPLSGMTPLVQEFWAHDNPDKFLVCLSAYEALHYSPEKLRKLESKYAGLSESERQARMNGIPTMGSGVVFPVDDKDIWFDYEGKIPETWERIGGLDFGRGDHPTAVVWCARDPMTDTVYVYDCIETIRKSVAENASLMRRRGAWIPISYPHDLMRDSGVSVSNDKLKQTEGYRYKQMYEDEGVTLTPTNAKTVEGSTKVEVGICEMRQRMLEGRLKVAKHLSEWFKEKQTYRYGEDGKPIKEKDHLLDATRYAIIMLRYAVSEREAMFDIGYQSRSVVDNTRVYDD